MPALVKFWKGPDSGSPPRVHCVAKCWEGSAEFARLSLRLNWGCCLHCPNCDFVMERIENKQSIGENDAPKTFNAQPLSLDVRKHYQDNRFSFVLSNMILMIKRIMEVSKKRQKYLISLMKSWSAFDRMKIFCLSINMFSWYILNNIIKVIKLWQDRAWSLFVLH